MTIHPPSPLLTPFPHNSQRLFARDCSGLKLVFGRIEFDVATPLPGYRSTKRNCFQTPRPSFLNERFAKIQKKKREMNSSIDRMMRLVEKNCWINCSLDWYKLILFWILFSFFFSKDRLVSISNFLLFFFYLSKGLRSKRLNIWKFMVNVPRYKKKSITRYYRTRDYFSSSSFITILGDNFLSRLDPSLTIRNWSKLTKIGRSRGRLEYFFFLRIFKNKISILLY